MNDAALDDFVRDFNESASEIWEKRFRNSSKCSSVDKWLNMMRFVLKESWTNDDAWWFEEERCMRWDSIFNKENEICLLIDLIDSLANNEDSLSLNLQIDLILEQFTKILYRDSHNWVNFTYLMSDKQSSNSNSLVVNFIQLSSVVLSFNYRWSSDKWISLDSFCLDEYVEWVMRLVSCD